MVKTFHQPPQVFTVPEAAEVLRISRASLYRLVRSGEVPHRRIHGTGVRFTADDLNEVLDGWHRPAMTGATRRARPPALTGDLARTPTGAQLPHSRTAAGYRA